MALSIGVTAGTRIRVDEQLVHVLEARPKMVTIRVDNSKPRVITDEERTEILPRVFVQCGVQEGLLVSGSRLAFEAPREIKIERVREALHV